MIGFVDRLRALADALEAAVKAYVRSLNNAQLKDICRQHRKSEPK